MKRSFVASALILIYCSHGGKAWALTANPILSRGKPVFVSGGNAAYLVDNKFGSGAKWSAGNSSWIAVKLAAGPTKVFINWNDPVYAWSNQLSPASCPNNNPLIADYDLLTSANSTNGSDGDWTVAVSITGNIVTTRGHLIDFAGKSWVKMSVKKGGGSIDEFEVFDASLGAEDTWFFVGTSISANTYKSAPPAKNFADLVTQAHPGFNPAMIRGGIGCITTNDMVRNLSNYLKMAGNAHFWAIEQGTNDAWGGTNANVALFTKNLQIVIDSCKARGIQPIIARMLATGPGAGWQVHQDYEKAIDELAKKNNLIPGPDLFAWFLAHGGDLNSDGVHPNAAGDASIQRLWAEKMDSIYKVATPILRSGTLPAQTPGLQVRSDLSGGGIRAMAAADGIFQWFDPDGTLLGSEKLVANRTRSLRCRPGMVFCKFTLRDKAVETARLLVE
ncbi:MAG: GDSL-type esterase/lipase family protein [Fibrobacteria bacterium]